jgi:hypothetical protein
VRRSIGTSHLRSRLVSAHGLVHRRSQRPTASHALVAAKALARTAIELLTDASLRDAVASEHRG